MVAVALTFKLALSGASHARQTTSQATRQSAILINNVRVFDGISDQLKQGNLLIEGRKIKRISSTPIAAPPGAQVIDGGGRVLMPGLTDAHWHMTVAPNSPAALTDTGLMYANLALVYIPAGRSSPRHRGTATMHRCGSARRRWAASRLARKN